MLVSVESTDRFDSSTLAVYGSDEEFRASEAMMGSERTHHHVTKQKSDDTLRRSTLAMDFYSMENEVGARSGESVTCTVVKEDIHLKESENS